MSPPSHLLASRRRSCSSLVVLLLAASGCGPRGTAQELAQQCAPDNSNAPGDAKKASLQHEKAWIRAFMGEAYLWNEEIPKVDPEAAEFKGDMTPQEETNLVPGPLYRYFHKLKTTELTETQRPRDRFSFAVSTRLWRENLSGGLGVDYGIRWAAFASRPPRRWSVAFVEPDSPAARAGVARGDALTLVDGVDFESASGQTEVNAINAGLFPDDASALTHRFRFTSRSGQPRDVELTAEEVSSTPVPVAKTLEVAGGRVGYLVFNSHILKAEAGLIAAFAQLKADGVSDLVLDLRFNSGGLLALASQVAYMVAGPGRTAEKPFEEVTYNARRSAENVGLPFVDESCLPAPEGGCSKVEPLPALGLSRVFVLTSGETCSASESIINSLRGVDVEVLALGRATCGKPYGFVPRDNCGNTYAAIEFKGANAKGFGDYADGFAASCEVVDEVKLELGDPAESLLAAALGVRASGKCPDSSLPRTGLSAPVPRFELLPAARVQGKLLPLDGPPHWPLRR